MKVNARVYVRRGQSAPMVVTTADEGDAPPVVVVHHEDDRGRRTLVELDSADAEIDVNEASSAGQSRRGLARMLRDELQIVDGEVTTRNVGVRRSVVSGIGAARLIGKQRRG